MKYNGCDKNLTQKYQLLDHVEVKKVYTTGTYSILSSIFTVDGGEKNFEMPIWICLDIKLRKFRKLDTPKQGTTFENFTPKQGE